MVFPSLLKNKWKFKKIYVASYQHQEHLSAGTEHVIQNCDHFHINKDMLLVIILGGGRTEQYTNKEIFPEIQWYHQNTETQRSWTINFLLVFLAQYLHLKKSVFKNTSYFCT